jgi:hypothetical protein
LALGGCASAPSSFRIVPAEKADAKRPLTNFLVLAPGVRAKDAGLYAMDIPITSSPWHCPSSEAGNAYFRARVLAAGFNAAVLRVTSVRHEQEAQLRAAWANWSKSPQAEPIIQCLSAQDLAAIPDRLAAARPVNGEQSLESALGLSGTRLISLAPGMTVCASDGFMRELTADGYSPTGPFCARVTDSPSAGQALDPIRHSIARISAGPDSGASFPIRSIASWAEVPLDAAPREYVVRYPTALPPAGHPPPEDVSLLVSLEARLPFEVRQAAMSCIANEGRFTDFCESPIDQIPALCGNPVLAQMKVPPMCYRFGERGVMNISIPVIINGAPADVEAGALVRDAATRLGRPTTTPPDMKRWYGTKQHTVEFEAEAFDLPLLPGDKLSW